MAGHGRQRHLAHNINGYCGINGTGVTCPIGFSDVVMDAAEPAGRE